MPASRFSSYLNYGAETTPGEVPASPTIRVMRTTDPISIQGSKDTFNSEETYAHRQRQSLRHGRRMVDGSIPFEFSYGAQVDWLEALLGGAWTGNAAGTPNVLKVGTNVPTFFIEQGFPDITQHQLLKGVTPTAMSLDVSPDGIVTGSFDVTGMDFEDMDGVSEGAGSAINENQPFDGICNATISEGGTAIDVITSLSLSVQTGRTASGLVGNCGTAQASNGLLEVTGEMTAQLADSSLTTKFFNENESALEIEFADVDVETKKLKISLPRIKYTGNEKSENDNEVVVSLPFTALYDSVATSSIVIEDSNPA